MYYLPAESQEKLKNTGMGSLSLLQVIFPSGELNQGLLHCRWILYQLSCQGSPPVPKKGNGKECSNYCTIAFISHSSKVMLKILQVRLQQYLNHEVPDVQAGFILFFFFPFRFFFLILFLFYFFYFILFLNFT